MSRWTKVISARRRPTGRRAAAAARDGVAELDGARRAVVGAERVVGELAQRLLEGRVVDVPATATVTELSASTVGTKAAAACSSAGSCASTRCLRRRLERVGRDVSERRRRDAHVDLGRVAARRAGGGGLGGGLRRRRRPRRRGRRWRGWRRKERPEADLRRTVAPARREAVGRPMSAHRLLLVRVYWIEPVIRRRRPPNVSSSGPYSRVAV